MINPQNICKNKGIIDDIIQIIDKHFNSNWLILTKSKLKQSEINNFDDVLNDSNLLQRVIIDFNKNENLMA